MDAIKERLAVKEKVFYETAKVTKQIADVHRKKYLQAKNRSNSSKIVDNYRHIADEKHVALKYMEQAIAEIDQIHRTDDVEKALYIEANATADAYASTFILSHGSTIQRKSMNNPVIYLPNLDLGPSKKGTET